MNLILKLRNKFKISGSHSIDIHPSAKIRGCTFVIKGSNNTLKISANTNLRDCVVEVDGKECTLTIGNNTIIGHNSYLSVREAGTRLDIGNDCMFSRNTKIMTSDGHNIVKQGRRINSAKDISIGSHVWLADNTTILKGVSIGDQSIVGINSTLTKPISSGVIAVGNPAKVVQDEVSWQHELTY